MSTILDQDFITLLTESEQKLHEPIGDIAMGALSSPDINCQWVQVEYHPDEFKITPHAITAEQRHAALFVRAKEAL